VLAPGQLVLPPAHGTLHRSCALRVAHCPSFTPGTPQSTALAHGVPTPKNWFSATQVVSASPQIVPVAPSMLVADCD
jgi:hypothetical protein